MLKIVLLLLPVTLQLDLEEYAEDEYMLPQRIFSTAYEPNFQKQTDINTLIFFTPWNKQGKDLVMKYHKKWNVVSPCWYEVSVKSGQLIVQHESNYDKEYLQKIKKQSQKVLILPRFYVNQATVWQQLIDSPKKFQNLLKKMTELANLPHIDGILWDTPYCSFLRKPENKGINQLMEHIINSLKAFLGSKKLFVNVMEVGQQTDLQILKNLKYDGLLVQNYAGRSNPQQMENTIKFIKKLDQNQQYYVMLPFFSQHSHKGMISTSEAQEILNDRGISRAQFEVMCTFEFDRISMEVPCYNYFLKAFEMLNEAGLSVGFWEAGNGNEKYFSFI